MNPMFDNLSPRRIDIPPTQFYTLVDIVESLRSKNESLKTFEDHLGKVAEEMDHFQSIFTHAREAMNRATPRRKRANFGQGAPSADDFEDKGTDANFIEVGQVIFDVMQNGYDAAHQVAQTLRPGELLLSKKRYEEHEESEDIQKMLYQVHLNSGTLSRVLMGLQLLDNFDTEMEKLIKEAGQMLEAYHKKLNHRHTVEGIKIVEDPIITDIALSVYDNIDAHGEIEDGKKPDELSAYSVSKAQTLMKAVKHRDVMELICTPDRLNEFVVGGLNNLWYSVSFLFNQFKLEIEEVKLALNTYKKRKRIPESAMFDYISQLKTLNPAEITERDRQGLLSREERYALEFRNETVELVVKALKDQGVSSDDVVKRVLDRKAELRQFFHEENTFYVCKIGSGNAFGGEAPGALKVIPGQRPVASLDEIIGSGFDEVKDFINEIEVTSKWHDLFMATSPSKTADKANVLLIGPQGCGKSEILRAVGSDKDSIGVFAQGSDFLTCWMGEAEKNPKRLFEAGLKLSKEAKKRVHFLIDEIDAVMNTDEMAGKRSVNLTLEFQILMDGVVQYPNLSVWGATNHPQRIPTPMLRRFNKVLIVGELTQKERTALLKHFVGGFLPTDIKTSAWEEAAERMEGAVGDILRKVADEIWRKKMTSFVSKNPEEADRLLKVLNAEGQFNIADFDHKAREKLKRQLKTHVLVKPEDLMSSVDHHLGNLAIRKEIEVAQATYAQAHELVASLNQ